MEKHDMDLIIKEINNFSMLKEEHGYADVDDLIAHYIEEEIITSKEELLEVINTTKLYLGVAINSDLLWNDL